MSSNFHSRVGNPIPRGEKQKITVYFIKDSIVYWSGQFTGPFFTMCVTLVLFFIVLAVKVDIFRYNKKLLFP